MSISGFGATLEGLALGSFAGVKAIRVGGVTLAFDEVMTIEAHRDGTATFTNGSAAVTGVDSNWTSDMAGRRIQLDADGTVVTVLSVGGATALTLTANYTDTGGSGAYTMFPTRVAEHVPLGVLEQPISIDFVYEPTLWSALNGAALAQTEDTFTLTDVEGSTHVGLGRVETCGDMRLGSDASAQFTVTLMPTTAWEFTPVA